MTTFKATITITVAEINPDRVARRPKHYAMWFKDPANPTSEEFQKYAEAMLEDLGTSNTGSECMLGADLEITKV